MNRRVEVSRDIAASPEAIYAAISDVTRMGEWSIECHHCEWTGESTSAAVGATFDGHNRNGDNTWITQGTVVAADPGRAFAFECSMYDFHYATWGYDITPTNSGSSVTEWAEDFRPDEALEMSAKVSGVDNRTARNRETISGTLERLAAALES